MRRYLPLLPIPALAVLLAVSCSRKSSDEAATHVIPPAAPYLEPAARNEAAAASTPRAAPEEPPSARDVEAFERPVRK